MRRRAEIQYRKTSLGSGLVFVTEETLWKEFAGTGMTLKAFQAWLRAMKVPRVGVGGERFVRVQSFRLAMLAISRVGEKDFYAPGCYDLDRKPPKAGYTKELDVKEFRKNLKELVTELLFSQAAAGRKITVEMVKEASDNTIRMLMALLQTVPLKEQRRVTMGARKAGVTEVGTFTLEAVDGKHTEIEE